MSVSKEDLLSRWQSLHVEDRQTDGGPQKAEVLRNLMTQVQYARQTNLLCPNSAHSLMYQFADNYASIVDTPSEQKGLDNYAEAALSLVEGKPNESSQWTSTFSIDGIKDTTWGKAFFEDTKRALCSMLPIGGEATEIIMDPVNTQHTSAVSSTTAPQPLFRQSSKPSAPERDSIPGTSGSLFLKQSNQEQGFWNLNKRSDMSNPHKSVTCGQPPQKRFGTDDENGLGQGLFSRTNDDRQRQPTKRPREMASDDAMPTAFRTAKQQLVIDQQKKNNHGQGSASTVSYGTNKKSLGTRRGINSRFVPPVLGRGDEEIDGDDTLMKRVTSAVLGSTSAGTNKTKRGSTDEVVDERLKNIEPKMIEMISSEIMDHGPPVSWDDIAGLDFAKKTIKEIVVWPMLRPDIFTGLRGPPKGMLLFGPPGTGKTLIGKCIASQSKSTFFSISASSLTSKWVGEGEKMVRALFAVARVNQPAVIFIDEIDSLLSQRSDGENEASRRIKTEFLVQLDGATTGAEDRILVVGATNRPQEIDEAARRRFVKRLYIPLPEALARKQIVVNLVSQQSHGLDTTQFESIATQSNGYSGSDMANLCREAALGPIRSMAFNDIENISADQVRPITYADFQDALKQVRTSVSNKDLDVYLDWNKQYGSWGLG